MVIRVAGRIYGAFRRFDVSADNQEVALTLIFHAFVAVKVIGHAMPGTRSSIVPTEAHFANFSFVVL